MDKQHGTSWTKFVRSSRVQQAGQHAQQVHQWRRWHIAPAPRRTRGVHALSLHASLFHSLWWYTHTSWLKSWALSHSIHGHPHGALSLIRLTTFYFFLFLLSVPVFLFHLELFPELSYTKCMANNLRCSAAEESEDTLNSFTTPTQIAQNSKSECPDIWTRLPQRIWPKLLEKMEDPVVLLELGWEKNSDLGMRVRSSKTRAISVSWCGWHPSGWKEAEFWLRCGRDWWKNVDIDEPTSFLDHVHLGCTQREMQTEWSNHWSVYTNVRVTSFCWGNRKITGMAQTSRTDDSVVLWYGRTCSKKCVGQ